MYRVLIADDEPYIIEGIKHIINWEEYGIEISGTASNGIEALELLKKDGADILITDIKMPKMNGLEVIKNVKELKLSTRFIILSGYDDFEFLKESIKLGIENYLLKPINSEEFEETIVNVLNKIYDSSCKKFCLEKDINIIRNNILLRWVTGAISKTELLERASLLDIPLEASQYVVSVLRFLPNSNSSMDFYSLIQKAEDIYYKIIDSINPGRMASSEAERNDQPGRMASSAAKRNDQPGVVFCTPENNIVFVMCGLKEYLNLFKRFTCDLQKCMDINYFLTVGSVEDDYNFVSRSYFKAMELQQYSIIMPPKSLLEYSNFEQRELNRIQKIISCNEVCKYVLAKDLDSLGLYIDNTFKSLTETNGVTPDLIRNTAAELLFCIINSSRSATDYAKISISDLDYPFVGLFDMDSLAELCQFIKNVAARMINLSSEKNDNINPVIKRILNHIKTNYSSDICLKNLASDFNTNANYLGQLFKEETGEYFSDYLNMIRISKAKELLQNIDRSMKDISKAVGYKDVNYFYRAFKKYTGVSPSEFRNI